LDFFTPKVFHKTHEKNKNLLISLLLKFIKGDLKLIDLVISKSNSIQIIIEINDLYSFIIIEKILDDKDYFYSKQ
jgi:hypothetical protein